MNFTYFIIIIIISYIIITKPEVELQEFYQSSSWFVKGNKRDRARGLGSPSSVYSMKRQSAEGEGRVMSPLEEDNSPVYR